MGSSYQTWTRVLIMSVFSVLIIYCCCSFFSQSMLVCSVCHKHTRLCKDSSRRRTVEYTKQGMTHLIEGNFSFLFDEFHRSHCITPMRIRSEWSKEKEPISSYYFSIYSYKLFHCFLTKRSAMKFWTNQCILIIKSLFYDKSVTRAKVNHELTFSENYEFSSRKVNWGPTKDQLILKRFCLHWILYTF